MSPASYQTAPPRVACSYRLVPFWRAGNGTRTRDPNLGKVVLYQLSYSRMLLMPNVTTPQRLRLASFAARRLQRRLRRLAVYGGEGDRTPDLVNAIHALSQLSYAPAILPPRKVGHIGLAGTRHHIGTFRQCQANIFAASAY